MSQSEKAQLYNELKAAGVNFTKHYREYNTAELQEAVAKLRSASPAPAANPPAAGAGPVFDAEATAAALRAAIDPPTHENTRQPVTTTAPPPGDARLRQPRPPVAPVAPPPGDARLRQPRPPVAPVAPRDPNEMAGQRLNTQQVEMEPIRVDPETGFVWYQEEVTKPAYPKPRGRRVLSYTETGTRTETVKNGEYTETFEVAGDMPSVPAQVKITLPSYQVGIYKDPRFPFKIHVYGGRQGFDLFEVQNYYGGAELVPTEIKRVYVENVLCYDIRTTVRAIQTEYRQLQLTGKVK